jgi:hypothetical protein
MTRPSRANESCPYQQEVILLKISTKFDVGPVRILSDDHVFAEAEERKKYLFLFSFALLLLILAFCYNTPGEIWEGSLIILLSPANLITDYIALTNVGATLFNAAVMSFFSIAMAAVNRVKITGAVVAAFFTVAGFSLFVKNLYNSIPNIAGVYLYCRLTHNPFKNHHDVGLFRHGSGSAGKRGVI